MKITLDIPDEIAKAMLEAGGYSSTDQDGKPNAQTPEAFIGSRLAEFIGETHQCNLQRAAVNQTLADVAAQSKADAAKIVTTIEGKAPAFDDPAVAQADAIKP